MSSGYKSLWGKDQDDQLPVRTRRSPGLRQSWWVDQSLSVLAPVAAMSAMSAMSVMFLRSSMFLHVPDVFLPCLFFAYNLTRKHSRHSGHSRHFKPAIAKHQTCKACNEMPWQTWKIINEYERNVLTKCLDEKSGIRVNFWQVICHEPSDAPGLPWSPSVTLQATYSHDRTRWRCMKILLQDTSRIIKIHIQYYSNYYSIIFSKRQELWRESESSFSPSVIAHTGLDAPFACEVKRQNAMIRNDTPCFGRNNWNICNVA